MKVILDVDAISPPLTGIGRYTLELARGLLRSGRVTDARFFALGRWVDDPESLLRAGTVATLRRLLPFRRQVRWGYRHFNQWRFRRRIGQLTDYIYHSPNSHLMAFPGAAVVTVHDVSVLRHPGFHPRERVEFWQREVPKTIARASHVITDSEFSRGEIMELLGVGADRVSAIHLGVDPSFQPRPAVACAEGLARHGLRYKGYTLMVATLEPRKNFQRLLQAFESLPAQLRREFPLAVAGDKGWLSGSIHATVARLSAQGDAIMLGYVPAADLPVIYSGAAVFAYPSLYEGFGLPVLEAMASGVAVVSSNCSSIPEVAGEACLLVDPYSLESIAEGLRALLSDEAGRRDYERAGPARASMFSWNNCLDRTLDVYAKLQ